MRKLLSFFDALRTSKHSAALGAASPLEIWFLAAHAGRVVFGGADTV